MFAETRWGLAMSMYPRLLGIAAVVFGFGLSEALTASDVWKGSWKFEIERQRAIPYLTYYDTSGKPVFRIACGMHFEIDAVYPGASPKRDTTGSLTIANGKTQMDFAGFILLPQTRTWVFFPICLFSTSRTSAIPRLTKLTKINGTRWKIASSIFWTPGSR
jgi:hypothetical protein